MCGRIHHQLQLVPFQCVKNEEIWIIHMDDCFRSIVFEMNTIIYHLSLSFLSLRCLRLSALCSIIPLSCISQSHTYSFFYMWNNSNGHEHQSYQCYLLITDWQCKLYKPDADITETSLLLSKRKHTYDKNIRRIMGLASFDVYHIYFRGMLHTGTDPHERGINIRYKTKSY